MDEHPFVICQINSLHRLRGEIHIFILDEVSYITDMIVDFTGLRTKLIMKSFTERCERAEKLIIMDALLDRNYLRPFSKMHKNSVRKNEKMRIVKADCTQMEPILTAIFYTERAWFSLLIEKLQQKVPIFICANLKKCCLFEIMALIKVYWPEALANNEVLIQTAEDARVPVSEWGNKKIVLISPTIVAGLSFEERNYFEVILGLFSNSSCKAPFGCQQLRRVRFPLAKFLHICVRNDPKQRNYNWSQHSLDHSILHYKDGSRSALEADINFSSNKLEPTIANDIIRNSVRRKMMSRNHYEGELHRHLKQQKIEVVPEIKDLDDSKVSEDEQERKKEQINVIAQARKQMRQEHRERQTAAVRSSTIDRQYYEFLLKKPTRTSTENNDIISFRIREATGLEPLFPNKPDYELEAMIDCVALLEFEQSKQRGQVYADAQNLNCNVVAWIERQRDFWETKYKQTANDSMAKTMRDIWWKRSLVCKLVKELFDDYKLIDLPASNLTDEAYCFSAQFEAYTEKLSAFYEKYKVHIKSSRFDVDSTRIEIIAMGLQEWSGIAHFVKFINGRLRIVNRHLVRQQGAEADYSMQTRVEWAIKNNYKNLDSETAKNWKEYELSNYPVY